MRIVVTGLGTICATGNNRKAFLQSLQEGHCGINETTSFDVKHFRAKTSGEVKNYQPSDYFDSKQLSTLDRFAQFAIISAREAIQDGQLIITPDNATRIAVIHGTGVGGQVTQDSSYYRFYGKGNHKLHPFTVPKLMPSASASQISMDLGIQGPVFGPVSACASASHAIALGMMFLQSGQVDVALVGGAEAPITPGCVRAWEAMRVISRDVCRPFSKDRGGMVIGEGAGTLMLETLSHAQARNAPIRSEYLGWGMCADAGSLLKPDVNGATRAMKAALEQAQLQPDQLQYVNAHGTGTPQNDPTETQAIHQVFGSHADHLAVSSTKSMLGHTLGASGALEAVATTLSIQHNFAPPTVGYLGLDPKCDLDYVPNTARSLGIDYAMSNSFAFGGLNVALVFGRYKM
ncbi:3-oxoacyl-(acyl-carrier-protein) synthase II [[Leptolyngbya] sp. PCC 7376]|uniref:beta-ketoacyl-[acyl-carrier-protein] synthase family protein n=1 Tax=[Leptolyngbya] sp. PCC 7376 TaxID=111781 RepID=UPI00029F09B5|nr:beta-ketoacyl-[acyl-carrier-protein] synthase family protein [[Leptolyngbya] sp. PCC 7376]AFY40283.1 3-oxoacyl-(acyl-carrier-protein) synthase II [[Leptolyngbya] sp. PCC 7376]